MKRTQIAAQFERLTAIASRIRESSEREDYFFLEFEKAATAFAFAVPGEFFFEMKRRAARFHAELIDDRSPLALQIKAGKDVILRAALLEAIARPEFSDSTMTPEQIPRVVASEEYPDVAYLVWERYMHKCIKHLPANRATERLRHIHYYLNDVVFALTQNPPRRFLMLPRALNCFSRLFSREPWLGADGCLRAIEWTLQQTWSLCQTNNLYGMYSLVMLRNGATGKLLRDHEYRNIRQSLRMYLRDAAPMVVAAAEEVVGFASDPPASTDNILAADSGEHGSDGIPPPAVIADTKLLPNGPPTEAPGVPRIKFTAEKPWYHEGGEVPDRDRYHHLPLEGTKKLLSQVLCPNTKGGPNERALETLSQSGRYFIRKIAGKKFEAFCQTKAEREEKMRILDSLMTKKGGSK